ncbi:hypothetical protein L2E82_12303 [Cichorium intybus]|uniref:Uncharacterized protein n=1 Tax=Cichorium intybus TaxID=13427 RepID=A0ACB9GGF5_CICIN|nr:hypothetical protein L2E82_12303 [Cichorium intybus]
MVPRLLSMVSVEKDDSNTNNKVGNGRVPANATATSASPEIPHSYNQTVVVENPISVDESAKLVSNVVVGSRRRIKPSSEMTNLRFC